MSTFDDTINIIYKTQDKALLEDFLYGLTTPSERDEIGKRVEIIRRLLKGQAQHEIASALQVGVATVTRGSREIQAGRFKLLRPRQ